MNYKTTEETILRIQELKFNDFYADAILTIIFTAERI
jgi:hypothetical protein